MSDALLDRAFSTNEVSSEGGFCAPLAPGFGLLLEPTLSGQVAAFEALMRRGLARSLGEQDAEILADRVVAAWFESLRLERLFPTISAPRGGITYIAPSAWRPVTRREKVWWATRSGVRKAMRIRRRFVAVRARVENTRAVWDGSKVAVDPESWDDDDDD